MAMKARKLNKTIPTHLIAPCGMNCRLCWGYIRDKNTCPGCRSIIRRESPKSEYRLTCKITNCDFIAGGKSKFCSEDCGRFPCARLKNLDKRYRTRYGMSMLENLEKINKFGVRQFIRDEKEKWACPECGEILCVHRPACLSCGYEWR